MPVPVQRTWVVGEFPTAAMFNANVRDAVNFLLNPPAVLVYNGAIAIAHATETYATFASERFDTENIHSTGANTSRLTCTTPGLWQFDLYGLYAGNVNGSERSIILRRNGVTVIRKASVPRNGGAETGVQLTTTYKLEVNDFVEFGMYQDSGGPLNCTPEFGMTWVGVG